MVAAIFGRDLKLLLLGLVAEDVVGAVAQKLKKKNQKLFRAHIHDVFRGRGGFLNIQLLWIQFDHLQDLSAVFAHTAPERESLAHLFCFVESVLHMHCPFSINDLLPFIHDLGELGRRVGGALHPSVV